MILIADSGSTKTHWCVVSEAVEFKHIFTKGINPFYQTENEITQEIDLHLQYHQANSKKNTINTLYKPFLVKEF